MRPGWKGEVKGSLRSEAAWLNFCLHPASFPEQSAKVWEPPEMSPAQAVSVRPI